MMLKHKNLKSCLWRTCLFYSWAGSNWFDEQVDTVWPIENHRRSIGPWSRRPVIHP